MEENRHNLIENNVDENGISFLEESGTERKMTITYLSNSFYFKMYIIILIIHVNFIKYI